MSKKLKNTQIEVGAQNCHEQETMELLLVQ